MQEIKPICPTCSFSLDGVKGKLFINCPRCNAWLKVDQSCVSNCLTCSKPSQVADCITDIEPFDKAKKQ